MWLEPEYSSDIEINVKRCFVKAARCWDNHLIFHFVRPIIVCHFDCTLQGLCLALFCTFDFHTILLGNYLCPFSLCNGRNCFSLVRSCFHVLYAIQQVTFMLMAGCMTWAVADLRFITILQCQFLILIRRIILISIFWSIIIKKLAIQAHVLGSEWNLLFILQIHDHY